MTGIIIFTAGREDAFQDYQQSVRQGHSIAELEPFLSDDDLNTLRETYEDDIAHLWGTSVESKWQKVAPGDVVLVYRRGEYIAQGRVIYTTTNIDLAEEIWNTEGNPWDESNPWKYLTFVTDIEEVALDAEEFNELVGYDESYRPQGFTRVADFRLQDIEDAYESVETAVSNLTNAGIRVHEVEDESEDDEKEEEQPLADRLVAASEDGDRSEEFEQLVAQAFTRLGCETKWIEGGGDTDVEITSPVHTVVEAKSRSNPRGVDNINATRVDSHRQQRNADHAIAVSRHFPPGAIDDAQANGITTLTAERLVELLEVKKKYAVPPEEIFELLAEPGAFQDDRLDQLMETVQERLRATETLLNVIEALEHAEGEVQTAGNLHWIIVGLSGPEDAPDESVIEDALHFLAHPTLRIVESGENGFRLQTSYENALDVLTSIPSLIEDNG
jgi:hypothetical protein